MHCICGLPPCNSFTGTVFYRLARASACFRDVHWTVAHSPSHTALACRSAVMMSFGAFPAEVPARVRFLHPLHNFTIVSYDPRQLSEEVSFSITLSHF